MCSKVNSVEWLQTLLLLSPESSESDPVSLDFEFSYDSVSLYYVCMVWKDKFQYYDIMIFWSYISFDYAWTNNGERLKVSNNSARIREQYTNKKVQTNRGL